MTPRSSTSPSYTNPARFLGPNLDPSKPAPRHISSKASAKTEAHLERARSLRRSSTMPERILWNRLRGGRLNGLKFRRQQPIGPFTVDFYCHEARLVIELDGIGHDRDDDEKRDRWLEGHGLTILRFSVSWFMRARSDVLARIGREAMRRIAGMKEQSAPAETRRPTKEK